MLAVITSIGGEDIIGEYGGMIENGDICITNPFVFMGQQARPYSLFHFENRNTFYFSTHSVSRFVLLDETVNEDIRNQFNSIYEQVDMQFNAAKSGIITNLKGGRA